MEPARPGAEGGTAFSVVRLEPGATREQAQAEIEAITAPVAERRSERDTTLVLDDVRSLLYPTGQRIMGFLLLTAGLVLVIGCVNLANMLLIRTRQHEREAGVRAALGASWTRLVRPLIFESLITGLAGAVLGTLLTAVTFELLIQQVPGAAYRTAPVGVDFRVLTFALGLGLLSGLVFGSVPAWRAARIGVQALIQQHHSREGGRRRGLARPLVAVQVALALVIVFVAGVAGGEFVRVLSVPLGFERENVLTVEVPAPEQNGRDRQSFYTRALEILARRAELAPVGATGLLPLSNAPGNEPGWTPESKEMGVETGIVHVLPGYFEAVGIRLLRGRLLEWADVRSAAGVAVVSESAAQLLFGSRDPIGAVFQNSRGRQLSVVGVVADIGNLKPGEKPVPFSYVIPGEATRSLVLVARARSHRDAVLADIRREIAGLSPNTLVQVGWLADSIGAVTEFRNPRFQTIVLASFGTLALGLTALGVFGVVAYLVASRSHELGVRLAVGATPRLLVRWALRQAFVPVAAGLLLGLLATQWVRPLAEAQLYRAEAGDAEITLAFAVATVAAVALLAAYLPARRAGNVDPIVVLREE
jgi:putative ABC transport system permease protein